MTNTRPDIVIPGNTWVDCYAASGISVGTAVDIFNKGNNYCNCVIAPIQPFSGSMGVPLYSGGVAGYMRLTAGTPTFASRQGQEVLI